MVSSKKEETKPGSISFQWPKLKSYLEPEPTGGLKRISSVLPAPYLDA